MFFPQNSLIPKSIATILAVVMIANMALFATLFQPTPAQAQWIVTDPTQIAQNIVKYVWDAAKWVYEKALDAKDTLYKAWDQFKSEHGIIAEMISSLLLVMMHQVLAKLTNDIVAWINGGGKGKIRVLQDPGKFLTDALDEAGGVLAGAILNVDPNTLCNPDFLKFTISGALTGPYAQQRFDEKVSCTFTGMAEGLQKFKKDFTNGGWQSFIEFSRKENNDIGIFLASAEELNRMKSEKSAEATAKLGISKGFLAQEKCTVTKAPINDPFMITRTKEGSEGKSIAGYSHDSSSMVGKTIEEVMEETEGILPSEPNAFKDVWRGLGGEIECKTVTPAEQISDLANKALQAPMKRLEEAIAGLTTKLGTGAGSVLKPYVLAIAGAGINLLLQKGQGLITNALTKSTKSRKTQRQVTTSLQEHTELAQSAGTLAGSVDSFRSFLLKAIIDFTIFASTEEEAIARMDVLGRTPINKTETEVRNGLWRLTVSSPPVTGQDCSPGYFGTGVSNACNTEAIGASSVYTNFPGKIFFEEAQWCGAYAQEVEADVENPPSSTTLSTRIIPVPSPCPTLNVRGTSYPGDCSDANWVQYDIDPNPGFEMATRILAYADKEATVEDRFIRQSIVGADTNNDGIPDGSADIVNGQITFEETMVNTQLDNNHDSIVDGLTAGSTGLYEMHQNFLAAPFSPGIAQAAVVTTPSGNTYIIGGYNQFGFSSRILRMSDGTFVNLPVSVAGSAAAYYPPNGRIYIFGGFGNTTAYNTIWEFNPANNAVRTMSAKLPSPAMGLSAAYFQPNGRIYLMGGSNNGSISDQILEYNQATDTIIEKNVSLPIPLAFAGAVTAGSGTSQRIYILGGFDENGVSSPAIFEYNPTASSDSVALLRQAADVKARGYLSVTKDNSNPNLVNIYGGQNEFDYSSAVEQYNAQTDSIVSLTPLSETTSRAGVAGGGPTLIGGIARASDAESAKIFPQGDIYYIPAHIDTVSITTPYWQKYFSPTFNQGTASLLNTKTVFAYADFTSAIFETTISSKKNTDGNFVWLSKPYPELYEKAQELQSKIRIIKGYNYPATGAKNYTASLADQLGTTPDNDPYDNNPNNPAYNDEYDANGNLIRERYRGSVTDVLNIYNNLTEAYQSLFAGVTDESSLEGVDKDFTIFSPEETNIKLALIGKRCPTIAPSATSSPELIESCPRFEEEYNMARRFIFEPDDTGANPTGLTTGFATNPFTGARSSALAGILNLDEMATQLQVLPPDKNIIKLIRLRQLLEQLQVSPLPIPLPGKVGMALNPNPLSGVDLIQISLPGYEHIQAYLNDTTTKNLNIQTLITAYGYSNAKDAYPEISKQLDDIFDDIVNQVVDKLKGVFLKRIDARLDEAKMDAQHRLERFIEYAKDINPNVKIEVEKQRGDQLRSLTDVLQISSGTSVAQIDTEQMFVDNGREINVLLSRSPLRLTNDERKSIIGSAVYKIKTLAKFIGIDTSSPDFSEQISQYTDIGGKTSGEYETNLDEATRRALKDVYIYYTGIFNQADQTVSSEKRDLISSCGYETTRAQYYCDLNIATESREAVRIYKDAKMKLEELKKDFALMTTETLLIAEEFQTLTSDIATQKADLEDFVKLLNTLGRDYDNANACVDLSTEELWKLPRGLSSILGSSIGGSLQGLTSESVTFVVGNGLSGTVADCKTAVSDFNKHLGQLADTFICGKINSKYQD